MRLDYGARLPICGLCGDLLATDPLDEGCEGGDSVPAICAACTVNYFLEEDGCEVPERVGDKGCRHG